MPTQVIDIAKALSSETRLNLIRVIGNNSLSLPEIEQRFRVMLSGVKFSINRLY